MPFYQFRQNNSGGSFDFNDADGITIAVIVEADNADEANRRAESIGIYFYGCDLGRDCDCCGDRWYPVSERDSDIQPCLYGQPVGDASGWQFGPDGKEICVHYKDGRNEWFGITKESTK